MSEAEKNMTEQEYLRQKAAEEDPLGMAKYHLRRMDDVVTLEHADLHLRAAELWLEIEEVLA